MFPQDMPIPPADFVVMEHNHKVPFPERVWDYEFFNQSDPPRTFNGFHLSSGAF